MRVLSTRQRAWLGALASLLAAAGLWTPAFYSLWGTGFGDWQFFHHMWEAGFVALTRYGEWPLWDPYHCGGITILGNPQSQHMSPLYLLALLAEPTLGSKLFIVAHAWAGFAGAYLFARREQGLERAGAALASLGFCASGFFVWHGSGGHSAFLPFYFTPFVLLAWRAAARDLRYAAAVAALLALVLLEGGVYPFPYLLLLVTFDALVRLVAREPWRAIVVGGAVSALLTALLGAIRLLPIADEISHNPRTMPSLDGVSLAEALEMLTARDHEWRYPPHHFVWPEYGTYVGWGILALGALGVLRALRPRWRGVLFSALLFFGFMLGDHGPASPWAIVHRLPIYDSLRVPSRFAVFFTFYLALLAGLGLDSIAAKLGRSRMANTLGRATAALPYAIIAGIAVDIFIVAHPILDRFTDPPIDTAFVSPRHFLSPLPYGRYYASFPRMNLGSRGCYEAMTFTPARGLWVGDRPQARVLDAAGALVSMRRTTSRVFAEVRMERPGRVLFNQNFAPGWRSNLGQVASKDGMLAVDLPEPGTQRIALVYRPRTLVPGCALSALGLLLCLGITRLRRPGTVTSARAIPQSRA